MAAKFLQFIDAADDAAMFPVDNLQSITCAADGTVICKFSPGSLGTGQAASIDLATLTVTADKEKQVMDAIADAIVFGKKAVVVVCDDVNNNFIDPEVLSCTITLDA